MSKTLSMRANHLSLKFKIKEMSNRNFLGKVSIHRLTLNVLSKTAAPVPEITQL